MLIPVWRGGLRPDLAGDICLASEAADADAILLGDNDANGIQLRAPGVLPPLGEDRWRPVVVLPRAQGQFAVALLAGDDRARNQ